MEDGLGCILTCLEVRVGKGGQNSMLLKNNK